MITIKPLPPESFGDEPLDPKVGDIVSVRKISWALSEFELTEYKIYLSGIDCIFSDGFGSNVNNINSNTDERLHLMILDFCEVAIDPTRLKFKTPDQAISAFVKVLIIENSSTCWIAKKILLGDMSR